MRIARIRTAAGTTTYAMVEGSSVQPIEGDLFGPLKKAGKPLALAGVKLLAPVAPAALLGLGLNYQGHIKDEKTTPPQEPILFLKHTCAVIGPGDPIVLPASAPSEVDYEAELAVVIARTARNVERKDALAYVLGFTCANDVSARDVQNRNGQWARGKSFDTFCPLGPWIETDLDAARLRIQGRLNGKTMQDASTADLIFDVSYLVSFLSQDMTLLPGTVLLTGTPAGCARAYQPPAFLKPGDTFEVDIEGIGVLRNPVAGA
jgi:2-keto-4-pentenoate hydratase/2-oxohepta-3-ene-1,7-dioic acid hydratase in catechol pathway